MGIILLIVVKIHNTFTLHQWRSQGHCFGRQIASGEGILEGPPPPPILHGFRLLEWS